MAHASHVRDLAEKLARQFLLPTQVPLLKIGGTVLRIHRKRRERAYRESRTGRIWGTDPDLPADSVWSAIHQCCRNDRGWRVDLKLQFIALCLGIEHTVARANRRRVCQTVSQPDTRRKVVRVFEPDAGPRLGSRTTFGKSQRSLVSHSKPTISWLFGGIEVPFFAVNFAEWRVVLVPQSQVQSQARGELDVICEKEIG